MPTPAAPAAIASAPTKDVVDVAIAMLRPVVEAAIADTEVSADRALVIVVQDDDATLGEYTFGDAGRTRVNYASYARDKAALAKRERADTSLVRGRAQARGDTELPLIGGVHRRGVTIGVSGAQAWFDEAFGIIVAELVHALEQQRVAGGP